jgi:hypothetical protein
MVLSPIQPNPVHRSEVCDCICGIGNPLSLVKASSSFTKRSRPKRRTDLYWNTNLRVLHSVPTVSSAPNLQVATSILSSDTLQSPLTLTALQKYLPNASAETDHDQGGLWSNKVPSYYSSRSLFCFRIALSLCSINTTLATGNRIKDHANPHSRKRSNTKFLIRCIINRPFSNGIGLKGALLPLDGRRDVRKVADTEFEMLIIRHEPVSVLW